MTKPELAIVWSPEAETDLIDIWLYGAQEHSPAAADRRLRAIDKACRRLMNWPHSGLARPEIARGLRSLSVAPHVVFYRVTSSAVEIVRILHARRDVDAVFTEDQ
jgi:toxin ParE1/3/4